MAHFLFSFWHVAFSLPGSDRHESGQSDKRLHPDDGKNFIVSISVGLLFHLVLQKYRLLFQFIQTVKFISDNDEFSNKRLKSESSDSELPNGKDSAVSVIKSVSKLTEYAAFKIPTIITR